MGYSLFPGPRWTWGTRSFSAAVPLAIEQALMSRGFAALAVTCAATAGTIAFVHWDQRRELNRMREGVYIDAEREAFRRKVTSAAAQKEAQDAAAGSGEARAME